MIEKILKNTYVNPKVELTQSDYNRLVSMAQMKDQVRDRMDYLTEQRHRQETEERQKEYYQIREMAESDPDYLEAIIKVAKEMG